MLKTAYQMGVKKAFDEENVDELLKEAKELGIDLEKLGFLPGIANIGKALWTGGKALGAGMGQAAKTGLGYKGLGAGLRAFGRGTAGAWRGLNPLQRCALMGAGGAGLFAM